MRSLSVVLVFMAIFAGCAYFEHKELEARLDAESEYAASKRELAADYGDSSIVYHHSVDELAADEINELNTVLKTVLY